MSDFYGKKQDELHEEVRFLTGRKREIAKISDEKRIYILDILEEIKELRNEENAIIKRLEYLKKSELNIYKVFLPYDYFISSIKNDIYNIKTHVESIGDDNE